MLYTESEYFQRQVIFMNQYTIIAGVNGTGKSSLRGVLEGQGVNLGHIIDPDQIARKHQMDTIKAGRQALAEIDSCLRRNSSFTQEDKPSPATGLKRISNRPAGRGIISFSTISGSPPRRKACCGLKTGFGRAATISHQVTSNGAFSRRWNDLKRVFPYCDEVIFYDKRKRVCKGRRV